MIYLSLSQNGKPQKFSFSAQKTDEITIGRSPSNDVCIKNLSVSSKHAKLNPATLRLVDLNSTNGTLVNGESIQSKALVHGDVIRVGEIEIKFSGSKPLPDNLELIGDGPSFKDTLCSMIGQAKCFENFTQPDIEILAKYMKAYHAPAGATVFHEGERTSCLWVLIEGSVNVCKKDKRGVSKQLSSIRPGRLFGEISLVDYFPYSASIVTETESSFLLISRENFSRCVDDYPLLGVRLLSLITRTLCARLRAASGQLADFLDSNKL